MQRYVRGHWGVMAMTSDLCEMDLFFRLSYNRPQGPVFNVRSLLAEMLILLHRCVGSQHIKAGVVRVSIIYVGHPCPGGLSDNFFPHEHCQNTLVHIDSGKRPGKKKRKNTTEIKRSAHNH